MSWRGISCGYTSVTRPSGCYFEVDPPTQPAPAAAEGRKDDAGKARWELLCWPFLTEVAEVLEMGARKYSDDNWKRVSPARYVGAAMRHLAAHFTGERLDAESGKSHLAHAACCLMFLYWHGLLPGEGADDGGA